MPLYKYTAIDDYGKKVEAELEAEHEKALEVILANEGYYLLDASTQKPLTRFSKKVVPQSGGDIHLPPSGLHLHKHIHQDFNLNAPLIIGLIGLLLIIGGCFAPFMQVSFLGSYSIFLDGRGDGVGIVVLSGVSIWLLFIRRYKIMLILMGVSAAIVLANIIYFIYLKYYYKPPADTALPPTFNNVYEEAGYKLGQEIGQRIGEFLTQTTHLDWGLGPLITGHILVFVAIAMGIKSIRGNQTSL